MICMLNVGALYPENGYSENESDYFGYSNFKVAPKLGFKTNISVGLSYTLFKNFAFKSLFGVCRSSWNYAKTGISFSKYGILGIDSFRGVRSVNTIKQNLILLNGISISMIFYKLLKTETTNYIKK